MKEGRSIEDLAAEITRQNEVKADYVADTRQLTYRPHNNSLEVNDHGVFEMMDNTHRQMQTHLGIPAKYYRTLENEHRALLALNLNYWFTQKPEKRMIRTLDQKARAFLSSRYRPLDNHELVNAILPQIIQADCRIESAEITDTRLYIKAVSNKIEAEVKVGDPVQAGLILQNSEVGLGSIQVKPLILRLVCINGMIAADYGMSHRHVGRNFTGIENGAQQFWRDRTRSATDTAFWMQVQDTVGAVLQEVSFTRIVKELSEAAESDPVKKPIEAVEKLQKQFNLADDEKDSILGYLTDGGDLTKWGVANAVTRYSQDVDSYDRATDLEGIGYQVIKLKNQDWKHIADSQ